MFNLIANAIEEIKDVFSKRQKSFSYIQTIYNASGILGVLIAIRMRLRHRATFTYGRWIKKYDTLNDQARRNLSERASAFKVQPLISVIMPVYNPPLKFLDEAIHSIRKQIYSNWQLCIADDASTDPKVRALLLKHASEDSRIQIVFRTENGHISKASNSALALAKGQFVALFDNDDVLPEQALFWVVEAINQKPDIALIYSDEDKLSESGKRIEPYFKCDWDPFLILGQNLISHLGVYRKDILDEIGGFREGFEGSQDYDLALRFVEKIKPDQIYHIPRILYHWRVLPGSTSKSVDQKPYAVEAGRRAVSEHLARRNIAAEVDVQYSILYRIHYLLPEVAPLVSIIVSVNKDPKSLLRCINSISKLTDYPNFEVFLSHNEADSSVFRDVFDTLKSDYKNVYVVNAGDKRDSAALNNAAAKYAKGEVLVFIHDDIEVKSKSWLAEMVSVALQPEVGAVGARIWYPNNLLWHGGIIFGKDGCFNHSHEFVPYGYKGYFGRAVLMQRFSAVSDACLAVQKLKFVYHGKFNEVEVRKGWSHLDFCLKLTHSGYTCVWLPHSELFRYPNESFANSLNPKKLSPEFPCTPYAWSMYFNSDPSYNPNLSLDRSKFALAWPPRLS